MYINGDSIIFAPGEVEALLKELENEGYLLEDEEDLLEDWEVKESDFNIGNIIRNIRTGCMGVIVELDYDQDGEEMATIALNNKHYDYWAIDEIELIATNEDVLAAFSDVK